MTKTYTEPRAPDKDRFLELAEAAQAAEADYLNVKEEFDELRKQLEDASTNAKQKAAELRKYVEDLSGIRL